MRLYSWLWIGRTPAQVTNIASSKHLFSVSLYFLFIYFINFSKALPAIFLDLWRTLCIHKYNLTSQFPVK
ncbi:hypothetical protein LguiA_022938 [Lonicera macranthoides]